MIVAAPSCSCPCHRGGAKHIAACACERSYPSLPLRYFLDGREVSEEEANEAEDAGVARVSRGASGAIPERLGGGLNPWIELESI